MEATTSDMFFPSASNEDVSTDSTRDYNIDELVASQPKMIDASADVDMNSIPHNSDTNEGVESDGPNDALDASDNEEYHTRIPNPSRPLQISNGFDFHNYECFNYMGFGEPIKETFGGNINIQRWSYDDEPDLKVGMRFTDNETVAHHERSKIYSCQK